MNKNMIDLRYLLAEEKNKERKLDVTDEAGIMAGVTSAFYLTAMQLEPIQEAMINLNLHNENVLQNLQTDCALAGSIGVATGVLYLVGQGIERLVRGQNE